MSEFKILKTWERLFIIQTQMKYVVKTYAMIPGDEKYVDAVPTGVVKYYEGAYWIDHNNSALRLFQESIQIEVIGNIHENPELLGGNK